ncbi:hypothetical protein DPMN_162106 [Dreissena polymorpha]|uniref:Uncharacterized protein n=2 Tax=Dreissena polymorpha TaxID=45954 RepID=A0A9D4ER28_DREPO|nr:hypothetical protein DPMN_162106 [Dreissena polymorpha]
MLYLQKNNFIFLFHRAKLINKTEESRLLRLKNLIEKERRFAGNLQNRVIRKTSKSLTERRALLDLLENEYKVKNFITMKPKFDPGSIDNVEDARRYVIESRVFNSGFNLKSMKPEVRRKIRMLDPIHKYKVYKEKLLADNWQQNVEINRAISDSTFNMMLSDRKHWREYNFPPGHPRWQKSEEIKTSSKEASRSRKSSQIPALVNDEIQQVREVNTVREEVESDRTKEKSVVLERRQLLPRNPNAFSMSMRSLGPVYFQTTVSTLPVLQNTL